MLGARRWGLRAVAHEKFAARTVAAEATVAAKQELEDLETEQRVAPKCAVTPEQLVRTELRTIDAVG